MFESSGKRGLNTLASYPAALGSIPSIPKIIDVAEVT